MLATRVYRQLLQAKANLVQLPTWRSLRYRLTVHGAEWLEALVLTESSGNPKARRYEPHQDRATRRDAPMDPDTPGTDDGLLEDDASYGLMQVMGYNIRNLVGVQPVRIIVEDTGESHEVPAPINFAFALLPDINTALGLRVLLGELAAVHGDVERALARYNGGPTGDDVIDGDMRLRRYVDKVAANCRLVLADIEASK